MIRISLRRLFVALSLLAGYAALALAGDELPTAAWAGTRPILERDEAAAVESDNIEPIIISIGIEGTTDIHAAAVAAAGREADPVGMRRRLPGIALRLERAAVIGDDVALVKDRLGHPQLDERQLTGRTLFAPWA